MLAPAPSRPQPSHLAAAAARVQEAADEQRAALEDWAEREARADGSWLVGELAAGTDDRRAPPPPDAGGDPFAPRSGDTGQNTEQEANAAAGGAGPTPLPSMREVISTASRYVVAAARVQHALLALSEAYREQARAPGWSSADLHRALSAGRLADDIERRRLRMLECVTGTDRVPVFRCRCCGARKLGVPMTCNSRVCPRCARKVRHANQAKVHDILEHVDDARRRAGRGPARWRFVTLTMPSMPAFLQQRDRMGAAWSRLTRSDVWRGVGACVAAWETTHTAAGWHVHVHAIVDAYLPRPLLCRRWASAHLRLARTAHDEQTGQRARAALAVLDRWFGTQRRDGSRAVAPVLWGALRADAAWRDRPGVDRWRDLPDDAIVEPRHLRDAAMAEAAAAKTSTRRERIEARVQVRAVLREVPRAAAQHVRGTEGDRAQIVHELAKYVGKDLGGAGVDREGPWGVAGTPARLAEFVAGIRRWRALRAYGLAFDARLREDREAMACDGCGEPDLEFERLRPLDAAALAELRRQRQDARRRREATERAPPPTRETRRVAAPAAAATDHDAPQALRDALAWWRTLDRCVTSTQTV